MRLSTRACTVTSLPRRFCWKEAPRSTRSQEASITPAPALHYAALNGQRAMVEFLIDQGADVTIQDTKVFGTPAGWADYGGHPELKDVLRRPKR